MTKPIKTPWREKDLAQLINFRILDFPFPVPPPDHCEIPSYPAGLTCPPGRHLALFGERVVPDILRAANISAMQTRSVVCRARILVRCQDLLGIARRASVDNLAQTECIDLTTLTNDLAAKIGYAIGVPRTDPEESVREDMTRLNRLWADPEFAHIKLILMRKSQERASVKVGIIRSPDDVERIEFESSFCSGPPELMFAPPAES